MSGDQEFGVQEILNQCFVSTYRGLAAGNSTTGGTGDGAKTDLSPQVVFNRIFHDLTRGLTLVM